VADADEFMTVAEVAAILTLNQQTVRNWIDAGTLPAYRIGRRVTIRRSDFDRLIQKNYNPGTRSKPSAANPSATSIWDGETHGDA
jgi:excisionase family DNA binding protein